MLPKYPKRRFNVIKFLSKWLRKIHRWLAVPTALLIPTAVILKFTSSSGLRLPPQIEQVQSLLMLILAISGSYLFLLPYIMKWTRKYRRRGTQKTNPSLVHINNKKA